MGLRIRTDVLVLWTFLFLFETAFIASPSAPSYPTASEQVSELMFEERDRNELESRLKFVAVVLRHGDRSPGRIIPMENYSAEFWPSGFKKLTPLGVQQTFSLGKYLRDEYSALIGDYGPGKVTVRSSAEDRAIDSAISLLHGLFPLKDMEWDMKTMNHSVPVETLPVKNDPLLKPSKFRCIALDAWKTLGRAVLWDTLQGEPQNKAFISKLRSNSGIPDLTLQSVEDIYRPLLVQRIHGIGVPNWVTDDVWARMNQLFRMAYTMEAKDSVESKFRAGLLTGKIVDLFEKTARGSPLMDNHAMSIFSTHAGTLLPLLSNLDVFDGEYPGYASSLMIELWEQPVPHNSTADDRKPQRFDHFVKLKFRNDTSENVYQLTPSFCRDTIGPKSSPIGCPLATFVNFLSRRMYRSEAELANDCNKLSIQLQY